MRRTRLGHRRLARAFSKEHGGTMSRSAAQRFLARAPPPPVEPHQHARPDAPLREFEADYFSRSIVGGPKVNAFNVVDVFNSGVAVLQNHYKQSAWATVAGLRALRALAPAPQWIQVHVDNGTAFDNAIVRSWAENHQVRLHFVPKASPWEKPFVERSNRTCQELLNLEYIPGRARVQPLLDAVRAHVNARENMNLAYRTPDALWAQAGVPIPNAA